MSINPSVFRLIYGGPFVRMQILKFKWTYKKYTKYIYIQQFLAIQIQFTFDICQIAALIGDDFLWWHKIAGDEGDEEKVAILFRAIIQIYDIHNSSFFWSVIHLD